MEKSNLDRQNNYFHIGVYGKKIQKMYIESISSLYLHFFFHEVDGDSRPQSFLSKVFLVKRVHLTPHVRDAALSVLHNYLRVSRSRQHFRSHVIKVGYMKKSENFVHSRTRADSITFVKESSSSIFFCFFCKIQSNSTMLVIEKELYHEDGRELSTAELKS